MRLALVDIDVLITEHFLFFLKDLKRFLNFLDVNRRVKLKTSAKGESDGKWERVACKKFQKKKKTMVTKKTAQNCGKGLHMAEVITNPAKVHG